MITNIPFLYVNIIALSCFTLMFVTFLATKKTPEIWAFLAVLLDCILWTGGSILMRLYKGQRLLVVRRCQEDGWVHVKTDVAEGYVLESYLSEAKN